MHVKASIEDQLADTIVLGILGFGDIKLKHLASVKAKEIQSFPGSEEKYRTAMVRAMYRHLGIDPTKTRPSSEAFLRRMRRGQPWPRINALVDRCAGQFRAI